MTSQVGASNSMIAWNATTDATGNLTTANNPSLDAAGTTRTSGTTAAGAALMKDSIQALAKPYETLDTESTIPASGTPMLEPGTGDIRMAYEQPTVGQLYKNLVAQLPKQEPSPENTFFESVNSQIMLGTNNGATKQMLGAAEKLDSTLLEVQAQVQFAIYHPDVPVDPSIKEIADKVTKKAEKSSQKEFGLDKDWEPSPEAFQKEAEKMDGFFQANGYAAFVMGDKEGIAADKLLFAQANPELAGQLDPETVRVTNKLSATAQTAAEINWGTPTGWKPETKKKGDNESAVNSRVRSTYTNEFEEGVAKLVDKGKISKKEALQLRAQFYDHNADIPIEGKLVGYLEKLVASAQETIQKKFGTPVGFAPAVPKWNSEGIIKGTYADKFIGELQSSNLSKSDQKYLTSVLFGQTPIGLIKGDLRKTLDNITEKVSKQIDNEFGVKFAKIPDIPPSYIVAASEGSMVLSKSALKLAQDFVGAKLNEAGLIASDDPTRVLILDAMKVIGLALDRLSQILTETAIADSELSKKNSIGQMEIQLSKLDKQRVQIKDQIEQFEKQQAMGVLGIILSIIMCVFAFFMGPVALAIAVTFTIIQNTMGMEKFIEMLSELLEAIGIPKAIAKMIIVFLLILVAAQAGPIIGIDIAMQIISESKVLQDIAAMFGASKETQQIFAMVAQIVIMVVVMVASFFFPPAVPEMAAAMTTTMANMAGQIVKQIVDMIKAVLNFLSEVLGPITKAVSAACKAVSKVMKQLMNELKNALKFSKNAADETTEIAAKSDDMLQGGKSFTSKIQDYLDKLKGYLEKVQDSAQSSLDDSLDPLSALEGAGGKAGKATGTIAKAQKSLESFESFMKDPSKFFKEFAEGLETGVKDLGTKFKDMLDSPEDMVTAAKDTLDSGGDMGGTLKQAGKGAVDEVKGVADQAADAAKATGSVADDVGTGGTQAVSTGKKATTTGEKVEDAAETATKTAKTFSEISSPEDLIKFLGDKMRHLQEDLDTMFENIKTFFRSIGTNPTQLKDSILELFSGIAKKLGDIKKAITNFGFDDVTQMLEGALKDIGKSFKTVEDGYGRVFDQLKKEPWKWGDAMASYSKGIDKVQQLQDAFKAMEICSGVLQMISAFMGIINNAKLAEMTREMGKLESDIKIMDGVLSIMQTAQNNLQKDIESVSEHKKSIQEMQKNKWDQLSRVITKLGAANQGKG